MKKQARLKVPLRGIRGLWGSNKELGRSPKVGYGNCNWKFL